MARLCEDGAATFVILDREPLYGQDDIARIGAAHAIGADRRSALWRLLEQAGRAYLDQRRLAVPSSSLTRVRQDLHLARRLCAQLAELTPQPDQTNQDAASIQLSRAHLAALREGERIAGPQNAGSLDEVQRTLFWLGSVYEHALEACSASGDPDSRWRGALTQFYTRTLARSWTSESGSDGERFLIDCRLPQREDGPARSGVQLKAVAAGTGRLA